MCFCSLTINNKPIQAGIWCGVKMFEAFTEMARVEKITNVGQKIPDIHMTDWLFNFQFTAAVPDINTNILFDCRWKPNIYDFKAIADHFKADFELFYDEVANCVYGTFIYKNGEFHDVYLEREDFDQVIESQDDDGDDVYTFRGEKYDDREDAYEILLEEKIKRVNNEEENPLC